MLTLERFTRLMRSICLFTCLLLIPSAFVYGQGDGGGGGGLVVDWMAIITPLIIAVGLPFATQLLKQFWPSAPDWLRTIAPVIIVPLLTYAGSLLSGWLGVPVDLSEIIAIITAGATLGVASTIGFKFGKRDPQFVSRRH